MIQKKTQNIFVKNEKKCHPHVLAALKIKYFPHKKYVHMKLLLFIIILS